VRVLDLTRVIAGPVADRTLAALGAEVLRIDPPRLPELPAQHLDTGPGKRSAILDLADAARREQLLAGADVLLAGYRSFSLKRFGISSEQLASRHPQLVQVWLS
jgi:crotonobetainyl-CoA:carnitine CoA-transferase CaiB-like acyl-CoA transferase